MEQPCKQARARRKLASFLFLVAVFSAIIANLQMYVPSGTRMFFITWSPFVADALKMWSVGIGGFAGAADDRPFAQRFGLALMPSGLCHHRGHGSANLLSRDLRSGLVIRPRRVRGGWYFLVRLLVVLFHLPLSMLLAAGEEIGWRGVLVPNLARAYGFAAAAFLPGVIWPFGIGRTSYCLAIIPMLGQLMHCFSFQSRSLVSASFSHG
jgi:hypothetical protein